MNLFTINETRIPGFFEILYHVSANPQIREAAMNKLLQLIENKLYKGLIINFKSFAPDLSITQILDFAEKELAYSSLRNKPSAYVVASDSDAYSFMQNVLINRGKKTALFYSSEEALQWLIEA